MAKVVFFKKSPPAVELYLFGKSALLTLASLKVRIVNLKKQGTDTTEEEKALSILLEAMKKE